MKDSSYSRLMSTRQSYVALSMPKGLKSFPTASPRVRKPVGGEEFRFFGKLRMTIYSLMRFPRPVPHSGLQPLVGTPIIAPLLRDLFIELLEAT